MPSPADVVGVVVTHEQLVAQQPLPVVVGWRDEPVMVPLVGLSGIDDVVLVRIDEAGIGQSNLWVRLVVADGQPDLGWVRSLVARGAERRPA